MPLRPSAWRRGAVLTMIAVAACSESSRRPPTTPQTSFPRRLELAGPTTVHLGKSAQYSVIAHQSDGSTRDVTAEARWASSPSDVLTQSERGAFTGQQSGEASVTASLSGLSARMDGIIVVPEGTFRLAGSVRDAGVPVEATVRIDSAVLGRTEVVATGGQYRIYGVAGETRVTAIKEGYREQPRTLTVSDHQRLDLDLELTRARADLNGPYRLTVTAARDCSTLPGVGRQRSFDASVHQEGPLVVVTLTSGQFEISQTRTLNRFAGIMDAVRLVFGIRGPADFYYYYYDVPDVSEVLSPGQFYGFDGIATVSLASPDHLGGTLDGWIRVRSALASPEKGECQSNDHTFVLAR